MRQQLHSVLSMAIIYTSHAPRVFSIDEFDWLKCQDEKNTDTHTRSLTQILRVFYGKLYESIIVLIMLFKCSPTAS